MKVLRKILLVLFIIFGLSFLSGCHEGNRTVVYRYGPRFGHRHHVYHGYYSRVYRPVYRTHPTRHIFVTPNRKPVVHDRAHSKGFKNLGKPKFEKGDKEKQRPLERGRNRDDRGKEDSGRGDVRNRGEGRSRGQRNRENKK